jgi:DNA end-binding protein Ku
MAPRANWKGFLKIGQVTCPVALYTAASASERIAFHTINRETGHRVRRVFVDSDTGKPVDKDEQVKGYEVGQGDYVVLEPEEVAAAVPESDKTLSVSAFVACTDIDDVYFDRPYYLTPSDKNAEEAFNLIREGMRGKKVAAIAQTVLFRRVRSVLIRAHDKGLIATTLNFDYEVRSAKEAFDDVPDLKIKGEMLELAEHILKTKKGKFDPTKFDDRYETAVAELVKAKLEGKKIEVRKEPELGNVIDLMAALRESAGISGKKTAARP